MVDTLRRVDPYYVQVPEPMLELIATGELHPHALAVWCTLRKMTNRKTRSCWPSVATLAKHSGIGQTSTRKMLAALTDLGYIKITQRRQSANMSKSNEYWTDLAAGLGAMALNPLDSADSPEATPSNPLNFGGSPGEKATDPSNPLNSAGKSQNPLNLGGSPSGGKPNTDGFNLKERGEAENEAVDNHTAADEAQADYVDPSLSKATEYVFEQWAQFHSLPRLAVSKKATNDMRLLHERGTAGLAEPNPVPWPEIRETIDWLFSGAARPWLSQNIKSPGALRKHWLELQIARGASKPADIDWATPSTGHTSEAQTATQRPAVPDYDPNKPQACPHCVDGWIDAPGGGVNRCTECVVR